MAKDFNQAEATFKDTAYKAIDKAEAAAKGAIDNIEWRAKSRVELLDNVGRKISDKVVDVTDRVKAFGEKVAVSEKLERVESKIKGNPLTSAAVIFGVGYLAAKLFSSSRKADY